MCLWLVYQWFAQDTGSDQKSEPLFRMVPPKTTLIRYFCTVYDHKEKGDLSKGYTGIYFAEMMKQLKNFKTHNNI